MKTHTKELCVRWLHALTAIMLTISVLFNGFDLNTAQHVSADDDVAGSASPLTITSQEFWIEGVPIDRVEQKNVVNGAHVEAYLTWEIVNNTENPNGLYQGTIDTYGVTMELLPGEGGDPTLYDTNGERIGTYDIVSGSVSGQNILSITLDEAVRHKSNIVGGAVLVGEVSLSRADDPDGDNQARVGVGESSGIFELPTEPTSGNVRLTKTANENVKYENGVYTQKYTLTVTITGEVIAPELNDDLAGCALSGGAESVTVTKTRGNVDGEPVVSMNGTSLKVTFPNVPKGISATYSVEYSTILTAAAIKDYLLKGTVIENNAEVKGTDPNGNVLTQTRTAQPKIVAPSVNKSAKKEQVIVKDDSDGKYYSFVTYTVTADLGTEYHMLTAAEINAALSSLTDLPGSGLKNWYYKRVGGEYTLVKTAAESPEIALTAKVLNGELVPSDFTYDGNTGYSLSYHMAYEVLADSSASDEDSLTNTVSVTDPLPPLKPTLQSSTEIDPDIGIDIMSKSASSFDSATGTASYTVTVDFAKMKDYSEMLDFSKFKLVDTLSGTNDVFVLNNIEEYIAGNSPAESDEHTQFLGSFVVTFTDANGKSVYFRFTDRNEPVLNSTPSGTDRIVMYEKEDPEDHRPAINWIKSYYTYSNDYLELMTMTANGHRRINSTFIPFGFKYNSNSFELYDINETFIKLMIDNGYKMTLTYKTKSIGGGSRGTNTAKLTYEYAPKGDPSTSANGSDTDSTGIPGGNPKVLSALEKSRVEGSFSVYTTSNGSSTTTTYNNDPDADEVWWKIEVPREELSNVSNFHIQDELSAGLIPVQDSLIVAVNYDDLYNHPPTNYHTLPSSAAEIYSMASKSDGTKSFNIRFTGNTGTDDKMPAGFANQFNLPYYGDTIVFLYKTTIDRSLVNWGTPANGMRSAVLTNKATPYIDTTNGDSSEDTVTVTAPQHVVKGGEIDLDAIKRNNLIGHYTLNINETRSDLVSGNVVVVRDTLPENFYLKQDSVRICEAGSDTAASGVRFDYDRASRVITFTLKDETAYVITYSVNIDYEPVPGWNYDNDTTNSVSIDGTDPSEGSDSHSFATFSMGARIWAAVTDGSIVIHKFANGGLDTNGRPIINDVEGAGITVYQVYNNNRVFFHEENDRGDVTVIGEVCAVGEQITDENGIARITELPLDNIYRIEETRVPEGYADAHTDYVYFILRGKDGVTDPRSIPAAERTADEQKLVQILGSAPLIEIIASDDESERVIEYENIEGITISGKKTWDNSGYENDYNGVPYVPEFDDELLTLTVYRSTDGNNWTAVTNADITWEYDEETGAWSYEVSALPKYSSNGDTYVYKVEEEPYRGFNATYNKYDITNTLETVDISIEKQWSKDSVPNGYRPTSVVFDVIAKAGADDEGVPVAQVTLSEENDWKGSAEGLPKYDAEGNEIIYAIRETGLNRYEPAIEQGADGLSYTVTNSVKKVSLSVKKNWEISGRLSAYSEDLIPASIDVQLMRRIAGEEFADVDGMTLTLTAEGGWNGAFNDLLKYDAEDNLYEYTVREMTTTGFVAAVGDTVVDGNSCSVELTNIYNEQLLSLTVTKKWDDRNNVGNTRHAIEFTLYRSDENGEVADLGTYTIDPVDEDIRNADEWSHTIPEQLPQYERYESKAITDENGRTTGYEIVGVNRYTYYAEEIVGEDDIYDSQSNGLTIVNTLDFGVTSVSVTKHWVDDGDRYHTRPASIVISLYADGELRETRTIDASDFTSADDWYCSFEDLDEFVYVNGEKHVITYTVTENEVSGYSASYDGFDITNTLNKTSVTVNKMDIAGSLELADARLEIFDNNGSSIGSWTSVIGETWTVTVVPGINYTLAETIAPEGYQPLSANIVFTVDSSGVVRVISGSGVVDENGVLIVNNTKVADETNSSETDSSSSDIDSSTDSTSSSSSSDSSSTGSSSSSSSGGSSSTGSSSTGSTTGTNSTGGSTTTSNASPATGSSTANTFAAFALLFFAASIVVVKSRNSDKSE